MLTLSREEQNALVEAFRAGDESAFMRLHTQVEPLVRRSLYRMVAAEDLDDVVQTTMIRAHRNLAQFQGDASFSTWCVSIGINAALGHLRKKKRRDEVIPHSVDETHTNAEGSNRSAFEFGYEDRSAERNLAALTVERGLDQLNAEQNRAIRMQLHGSDLEEIASSLGRSVAATKSILQRGKKALSAAIQNGRGQRKVA